MRLSDIRGQDRAIALLRRAQEHDRIPHAYLFAGPAQVGKHSTALALAAAQNCETSPGDGCNECASCVRIAEGNHPDVQTLARQGAAQVVPIESIRKQVLAVLGMPPHEAKARYFLIEEATAMQAPAANALLKTLEEPPARTHFILSTTAPERLLPTIRSRCQRVSFAALNAELDAELQGEDGEQTSATIDNLYRAACGDGEILLSAAEGAEKSAIRANLVGLATALHRDAVDAANAGQGTLARRRGAQATLVLEAQAAVLVHNANGQLALEDLLLRVRRIP